MYDTHNLQVKEFNLAHILGKFGPCQQAPEYGHYGRRAWKSKVAWFMVAREQSMATEPERMSDGPDIPKTYLCDPPRHFQEHDLLIC